MATTPNLGSAREEEELLNNPLRLLLNPGERPRYFLSSGLVDE